MGILLLHRLHLLGVRPQPAPGPVRERDHRRRHRARAVRHRQGPLRRRRGPVDRPLHGLLSADGVLVGCDLQGPLHHAVHRDLHVCGREAQPRIHPALRPDVRGREPGSHDPPVLRLLFRRLRHDGHLRPVPASRPRRQRGLLSRAHRRVHRRLHLRGEAGDGRTAALLLHARAPADHPLRPGHVGTVGVRPQGRRLHDPGRPVRAPRGPHLSAVRALPLGRAQPPSSAHRSGDARLVRADAGPRPRPHRDHPHAIPPRPAHPRLRGLAHLCLRRVPGKRRHRLPAADAGDDVLFHPDGLGVVERRRAHERTQMGVGEPAFQAP